jgi:hypothetical protein
LQQVFEETDTPFRADRPAGDISTHIDRLIVMGLENGTPRRKISSELSPQIAFDGSMKSGKIILKKLRRGALIPDR